MTRKKTTVTTVEEPLTESQEQDQEPGKLAFNIDAFDQEPDPGEVDLRKFFSSLGDEESRVKIFKYDAAGKPRFITECDIDSASELFLQENWGEGKYKLVLWGPANKYLGARTIMIGPGRNKPIIPEEIKPVIPANGSGSDSKIDLIMSIMLESQKNNQMILMEIIKNMGNNKSSATELAEIMAILKGSMPNQESTSPIKLIADAMPIVKELISLGSRGGAPEPKGWMETIKEVAGEIPNVIKGVAMMKSANAPAPMQPNPPAGEESTVKQIEGISEEDIMQLRIALLFLKSRARAQKDPATFINYTLDTLDEDQSLAIAKLLDRSYEDIAIIDPELLSNVYRPWFEEFFGGLRNALLQRDDSSGEPGDSVDTSENAGTGPVVVPIGSGDPRSGD